jgi:hypothetical protein
VYEFKDPSGITRAAVIAVWAYLASESAYGLSSLLMIVSPEAFFGVFDLMITGSVALLLTVGTLAAMVLVGCWTYRVSANAHTLSDELTITPGWAVGWHFIPIANLFKPFQAIKEAWMASHHRDWNGGPTPPLLAWWWGLWIVTNMLANISFRLQLSHDFETAQSAFAVDAAAALLNVPLCLVLIRMMKRMASAQLAARHEQTFA